MDPLGVITRANIVQIAVLVHTNTVRMMMTRMTILARASKLRRQDVQAISSVRANNTTVHDINPASP